MTDKQVVKVLFVCLGNICRSPTAHGVFQKISEEADLGKIIQVDSAGTAAYHVGNSPDKRSVKTAATRGYELKYLRARKVDDSDFSIFDYILAMDNENLLELEQRCPSKYAHKVQLFLNYGTLEEKQVPDPYYGGGSGFERVLDLVEDAAQGLLEHIARIQS